MIAQDNSMGSGESMEGSAELCMGLMRADHQNSVIDLLTAAGYWDDPACWRYLGDAEGNYSQIGNQQSEAVAALIEKVVNSVDARLMHACRTAGIDPTSSAAPHSIRAAVAEWFERDSNPDLEGNAGRISRWLDEQLTSEGRLLTVTATGDDPEGGQRRGARPCISIADAGEGQAPDRFPDTFMSLLRENKLRVHFVQGKYNMGGTGALRFCSEPHRLQLIVSRRDPQFIGADAPDRDREWGFTIVRREFPKGGRSSVFTYLAPLDATPARRGSVLSFKSDFWPIFPEANSEVRDAYHRASSHGSLVKLYEYEWQGGRSNIVQSGGGLLRRIDTGLPELALPVRVFECRPVYRGGPASFATNVLGIAARLERDKADKLESGFPLSSVLEIDGWKIRMRVYAFSSKKTASEYRTARQGVVFSVNGQTHATHPTEFFRRQSVGMGYLADSLFVLVDCSEIPESVREDVFMNSRDRLLDGTFSQRLNAEIEAVLREDATLKELRNRRRQQEISEKLADSKPLADVLKNMLRHQPTLAKLFLQGSRLPSPFPTAGTTEGSAGEFSEKTYPTFFRFKGLKDSEPLTRDCHIGTRVRVAFETDAADDYFVRDLDRGQWSLRRVGPGVAVTGARMNGPHRGSATLAFELPFDAELGDEISFEIETTDPQRVDPFVNVLHLTVRKAVPQNSGGSGKRQPSTAGKGTKGGEGSLALPNIREVTEDEWADKGFTEETALVVESEGGDVFDFFVNVDNKYLRIAQKESREEPKLLRARFVYALVLIGLSIIQSGTRPDRDDEIGIEKEVARASSGIAPVLLPMIEMIAALAINEDDTDL